MPETIAVLDRLPHRAPSVSAYLYDPTYYPVYTRIAELLQPQTLLEIGTLAGFSLVAFLEGSDALQLIVGVDNESYHEGSRAWVGANLAAWQERSGRRVRLIQYATLDQYANDFRLDLVHVDGDHSTEGALRDLRRARAFGPQVILADDVSDPRVRLAVEVFAREQSLSWVEVGTRTGLAIFDFSEPDVDHAYTKYAALGLGCLPHPAEAAPEPSADPAAEPAPTRRTRRHAMPESAPAEPA